MKQGKAGSSGLIFCKGIYEKNSCRKCRPKKRLEYRYFDQRSCQRGRSHGAKIERFDLYRLEKYTGCISCFGCKREKFKGHCICRDGLTPVLDAIREADGLIIGSPNYLGELSASFRALYERLIFQNLTYNRDNPCCNERMIPVLFIMTSNAPDNMYTNLLGNYQQTLTRFVGPLFLYSRKIN